MQLELDDYESGEAGRGVFLFDNFRIFKKEITTSINSRKRHAKNSIILNYLENFGRSDILLEEMYARVQNDDILKPNIDGLSRDYSLNDLKNKYNKDIKFQEKLSENTLTNPNIILPYNINMYKLGTDESRIKGHKLGSLFSSMKIYSSLIKHTKNQEKLEHVIENEVIDIRDEIYNRYSDELINNIRWKFVSKGIDTIISWNILYRNLAAYEILLNSFERLTLNERSFISGKIKQINKDLEQRIEKPTPIILEFDQNPRSYDIKAYELNTHNSTKEIFYNSSNHVQGVEKETIDVRRLNHFPRYQKHMLKDKDYLNNHSDEEEYITSSIENIHIVITNGRYLPYYDREEPTEILIPEETKIIVLDGNQNEIKKEDNIEPGVYSWNKNDTWVENNNEEEENTTENTISKELYHESKQKDIHGDYWS